VTTKIGDEKNVGNYLRTPFKNVSEKLPVECARKKWIKTEEVVWHEADIR